jgi:membrane fusion protein (multidrug efflux system)
LVLRHYEETDDAYVAGNQVQIMAQVSGSVTKVWADNTDFVQQGDPLVTLDQTDAQQAFEKANPAGRQRSSDASADDQQQTAAGEYRRQENRALSGADRPEPPYPAGRRQPDWPRRAAARPRYRRQRQAELDVAIQQYNANQAIVLGTSLEQQPAVLQAATEVRNAWLALQRTQIVSPISGYVSRRRTARRAD